MNKEFLGIRIKAWLVASIILALVVGFVVCAIFAPNIIKAIFIIGVICFSLALLASCIDTLIEYGSKI